MHPLGFLGIFVALVGGALLFWSLRSTGQAKRDIGRAQTWPEATAVIDAADVQTFHTPGSSLYSFEPKLRYRFQVGGREYAGERLRFGYLRKRTKAEAERLLTDYTPGSWVRIRYNPHDPHENVLEATSGPPQTLAAIMGILVLILGLSMTVAAVSGVFANEGSRSYRASSYR